jgi:hypothetical protein
MIFIVQGLLLVDLLDSYLFSAENWLNGITMFTFAIPVGNANFGTLLSQHFSYFLNFTVDVFAHGLD